MMGADLVLSLATDTEPPAEQAAVPNGMFPNSVGFISHVHRKHLMMKPKDYSSAFFLLPV